MSVLCRTSDISVVCDCPYAGKTRVIKENAENDGRRKERLQSALGTTRNELALARSVLVDTRKKLAALQRVLCMEFGWVVNPHLMDQPTWKNRVREESYLKSELIHLVDHLRQCDPRFRADPAAHPTRLSASAEDLLTAAQEETLGKLYLGYTVYHSEGEKQVGRSLWEFLVLRESYEDQLYHNKVMEREIARVKEKISDLQRQFLEDKNLIDYIADHHFEMKGCFLEVFPQKNDPPDEEIPEDSEALRFKREWERSLREKRLLLSSVLSLRRNLESVCQRIVRAEVACSGNVLSFRGLANKIRAGVLLAKQTPRRTDHFGKFSLIRYRSQKSQLDAATDENRYLRIFLHKAILSKTEDRRYYQQSLQNTAEKYRSMLEDLRSQLQPAAQTAPKQEEKDGAARKKKK